MKKQVQTKNYQSLTIQEVCKFLCLERRTVYELINSGVLTAFRVGKGYRVLVSDFEEFITRNKVA